MSLTPAALTEARFLLMERERRRKAYPLGYAELWDSPNTSQRRAMLLDYTRGLDGKLPRLTAIFGGNRTGKSEGLAMWCVAQAAGRDAYIDEARGRVEWVRMWLARNGLPEAMIPLGPSRVWVGSPAFQPACEQIRPKLWRWAPHGTRRVRWDQPVEAELRIPAGPPGALGVLVSKAYKQFDQDNQTWEGANIRAMGFDEEPNSHANLLAGLSRLIDQDGRAMMALTHLRGTSDWLITEIVKKAPAWFRSCYLDGADNPHIPAEARLELLAMFPPWQRAARARGEIVDPEGAVFSFSRGVHVVPPFEPPAHWTRFRSTDWGGRAPHVTWTAEVAELYTLPDGRELRSGDLVTYREVAPRRDTRQPAVSTSALLEMVRDAEKGSPEASGEGGIVYGVADSEDPGAIVEANAAGFPTDPATKGAGSVAKGLELVEALLQTIDPITLEPCRPRLYVTEDCPVLIGEAEGLRWAEPRPGREPEPDKRCPDHGPDTWRYMAVYRQQQGFR